MTAPRTSATINCSIYIKTHKLWKLCELSISIICHVNTCHEKDLSFNTTNRINIPHFGSFLLPPIVSEELVKILLDKTLILNRKPLILSLFPR